MKTMKKNNKKPIIIVAILLAILIIVGIHLFSFSIGSAVASTYIYVNTYNYPNMTQEPASISWSANDSVGSASGTCNTNIEYISGVGEYITQINAPYYPEDNVPNHIPQYAYLSANTNISICEIALPSSLLSQYAPSYYNAETGTFLIKAIGKNNLTSPTYKLTITLKGPNTYNPLFITIPLVQTPINNNSSINLTTTVPTTTSTTTTTTVPTTTTTPSTTTTNNTTTTINNNYTNNNSILQAISSFINNILKFFESFFSV